MSDHELALFLEDLADGVPPVDPPLGAVLASGRAAAARRSRRRGALVMASVVVAVVAVTVGPRVVVQQGEAEVLETETPAAPAAPVTPLVPDGTRLLGAGGFAIAVPQSWDVVDPPFCGAPPTPYVYLADPGPGFAHSCPPVMPTEPADVSSLAIAADRSSVMPLFSNGAERSFTLATGEGVTVSGSCNERSCQRQWTVGGTIFTLDLHGGDGAEIADAMGASLQAVPDGWTTVPAWPSVVTHPDPETIAFGPIARIDYLALVVGAGLVVDERRSQGHDPALIGDDTLDYGAVVAIGTEVAVDETR